MYSLYFFIALEVCAMAVASVKWLPKAQSVLGSNGKYGYVLRFSLQGDISQRFKLYARTC